MSGSRNGCGDIPTATHIQLPEQSAIIGIIGSCFLATCYHLRADVVFPDIRRAPGRDLIPGWIRHNSSPVHLVQGKNLGILFIIELHDQFILIKNGRAGGAPIRFHWDRRQGPFPRLYSLPYRSSTNQSCQNRHTHVVHLVAGVSEA
jgi:hypothetical protein